MRKHWIVAAGVPGFLASSGCFGDSSPRVTPDGGAAGFDASVVAPDAASPSEASAPEAASSSSDAAASVDSGRETSAVVTPDASGPTPWTVEATPLDAGTTFYGIGGTGPRDVWIVGGGPSGPVTIHASGRTVADDGGIQPEQWSVVGNPSAATTHDIVAVSAVATSDVWAVAGPDLIHWDSSAWSKGQSSNAAVLAGVWMAPTGGEAWAVGASGTTMHYGGMPGAAWTSATNGQAGLTSVQGTASNDVWAVGLGGAAYHWGGASWSLSQTMTTSDLFAVHCVSALDCWAVGGSIVHNTGGAASSWADVGYAVTQPLHGVFALGATSVWAVGARGTILHYDGASWSPQASPTTEDLFALWGADGGSELYAAGAHNTVITLFKQ